jgi:hypothetical protein
MNPNVTLIDNLPDIDSLDPTPYGSPITQQGYENHSILSPEQSQKYGNYIRKTNSDPSMYQQIQDQDQEFRTPYIPEKKEAFNMPTNTPSCLEVAEHIQFCPICSRFYNNDKTVYIIAIILLAIICCLLLKRVLNV